MWLGWKKSMKKRIAWTCGAPSVVLRGFDTLMESHAKSLRLKQNEAVVFIPGSFIV